MDGGDPGQPAFDNPVFCRIFVLGQLEHKWSDYLGGLQIDCERNEQGVIVSKLAGVLPDQSSLHGVLNTIHDLGLTLIFVQTTKLPGPQRDDLEEP